MIGRISKTSRRADTGFTLIELLVIIIILGILAGIVVFAVRGTDDKGAAKASAIDARIVRTALEAYCARHGQYPPNEPPGEAMAELVRSKFLSAPSEYHTLDTGDPLPGGEGNCNGWQYEISDPQGDGGTTAPPPPGNPCGAPDTWCAVSPPIRPPEGSFSNTSMVQLRDGRVFAVGAGSLPVDGKTATMIYDPKIGSRGEWSIGPPYPFAPAHVRLTSMILVAGTPDECDPNCGKVFASFETDPPIQRQFALYDPGAEPPAAWQQVATPPGVAGDGWGFKVTQISGGTCGSYCNKVLAVGPPTGSNPVVTPVYAWDPKSGAFEPGPAVTSAARLGFPYSLANGRVLFVNEMGSKTFIFDPDPDSTSLLRPGPDQACTVQNNGANGAGIFEWSNTEGRLTGQRIILACGAKEDLFAVPPATPCEDPLSPPPGSNWCPKAEIHSLDEPDGSWTVARSCGHLIPGGFYLGEAWCHVLASLPDGRVLANASNTSIRNQRSHAETWIFDPDTLRWSQTTLATSDDGTVSEDGLGVGVYISGPNCGNVCGAVLTAGYREFWFDDSDLPTVRSQLYQPRY